MLPSNLLHLATLTRLKVLNFEALNELGIKFSPHPGLSPLAKQ